MKVEIFLGATVGETVMKIEEHVFPNSITGSDFAGMPNNSTKGWLARVDQQMRAIPGTYLCVEIAPKKDATRVEDAAEISGFILGEFGEHDLAAIPAFPFLAADLIASYEIHIEKTPDGSRRRCTWCGSEAHATAEPKSGRMILPPIHFCPDGCVSYKIAPAGRNVERVVQAFSFWRSDVLTAYGRFRDREPGSRGC